MSLGRLTLPAALLTVLLAAALPAGAQQPALVQVDEVRVEPLRQTWPVLGRIVTKRQGAVAARVEGRVQKVQIDVGDRVAQGDPLVELDPEPLEYERDLAEAEHQAALAERATAEAEIALLENELGRITRLEASAAFSKAQMEDKELEIAVAHQRLATATARIAQFDAKLQMSKRDLTDTLIRAPFAGVVSQRMVSPGAYLRPGDPVVTMIDDAALEIEADVPADQLGALVPGAEITFTLADGSPRSATVRAVVPEENPLTRTRAVRLVPDFAIGDRNQGGDGFAVAQSVTIEVPIGEARDVVTVDKDGVMQRQGGAIVFMIDGEAASPRPVQLGAAVGGRFEVLGGLEEGDLVVVRGNERLQPGQMVTYPGAPEAPANGKSES
jgi:RND family efflux transporter MFP subunit